jgi:hypothetical protein
MFTLIGDIPHHLYVWVDSKFTHKKNIGFIPAVWFGIVSYPSRMWGCNIMLESGAVYRNLPPHAISFTEKPQKKWSIKDAQTWDCYGWNFSTLEYKYLVGLDCMARCNGKKYEGEYLFTAAPIGDGFSAYPEQAKEFFFIKLDNGRLTIQPTNYVVFREKSFTSDRLEFPKGLNRQTKVYSCE